MRRIASCARSYVFGPISCGGFLFAPLVHDAETDPHLAALTQLGYRQNRLCTSGINYLREMHAASLCHFSLRKCLFLLALRYLKE